MRLHPSTQRRTVSHHMHQQHVAWSPSMVLSLLGQRLCKASPKRGQSERQRVQHCHHWMRRCEAWYLQAVPLGGEGCSCRYLCVNVSMLLRLRKRDKAYRDLNDPEGWRFSSLRKILLLRFRTPLSWMLKIVWGYEKGRHDV